MSYGFQTFSTGGQLQSSTERPAPYLAGECPQVARSTEPGGIDLISFSPPAGYTGGTLLLALEHQSAHYLHTEPVYVPPPDGPPTISVYAESAAAAPRVFAFVAPTVAVPDGGDGYGLKLWNGAGHLVYNSGAVAHLHFRAAIPMTGTTHGGLVTGGAIPQMPARPAIIPPSYTTAGRRAYYPTDSQDPEGEHTAYSQDAVWFRVNAAAKTIASDRRGFAFWRVYEAPRPDADFVLGAPEGVQQLLMLLDIDSLT